MLSENQTKKAGVQWLWVQRITTALMLLIGFCALLGVMLITLEVALNPRDPGPIYLALINLNLLIALGFLMFIGRRIVGAQLNRRGPWRRARLKNRLLWVFTSIAVVPTVVVSIFAIVLFNQGIESWFNSQVTNSLENARRVAQAYLDEQAQRLQLEGEIIARQPWLAQELNQFDLQGLAQQLQQVQLQYQLTTLGVVQSDGYLLAFAGFFPPELELSQIQARGQMASNWVILDAEHGQIKTGIKLPNNRWLLASRWIPASVLAHMDETTEAYQNYFALRQERHQIQLVFTMFLVLLALATVGGAVWMALRLADKIVPPLLALMQGTQRVATGEMDIRLVPQDDDELGILTQSFNRMIRQLKQSRELLELKNSELDDRRRIVEAVLTGVRAAVMTLDEHGNIRLTNTAAKQLLDVKMNESIKERLPEVMEALPDILQRKSGVWQQQVKVNINEQSFILLVRVVPLVRKKSGPHAAVLTAENLTELFAAQRVAAWADIAQRLAHEIKNPLTPIQLSAERLQRKFGRDGSEQATQLNELTGTIIGQVESMRTLLNEFSSFARMPAAKFAEVNLVNVIDEVLTLQKLARPNIKYDVKYSKRDMTLVGDHAQLQRVFTNLFENAANAITEQEEKNTSGEIKVVVKPTQSDKITTSISDNGVGLPADVEVEKLFDPYVTTRKKGTGLGLAIVRRIIDEHQGQIKLSRRRGGGTTVEVTLPQTLN